MILVSKQPLVSVIIPVYNCVEFIGAAIDSALLQTYRNLEVIVVDDGSTDGTLALLAQYAAKDDRVRVIAQANGGVARARNRAIAEARGELIAPLDADDLWLPSKIERQVRRMLAAGDATGLVYCWWAWIDEQGKVLDRSPSWTIEGNVLEPLIVINFTGNASVPLIRRQALLEAGGYNETLAAENAGGCEDWEVVLRVAARHPIAVVPAILAGYRRRPGSMSTNYDAMHRSHRRVMQGIRQLRPELKPALFRGSENQFAMYVAGMAFWAGNLRQALLWGLRSGFRLPILVAPYVLKMMVLGRRSTKYPQTMRPGEQIDAGRVPQPLLPYDRIRSPLRSLLWLVAGPAIAFLARAIQAAQHARLRREATSAVLAAPGRKPRVLATSVWHFPVYSQTFVYREAMAMADQGFELRFAYTGANSRKQLPDDLTALWKLRRRILYVDATAARDLRHYQATMPDKVKSIARAIAAASGLTEDEVYAHRHFRHAFSFARFAEAWKPDYVHTYFFYEGSVFGYVASTLLGIPRGVSCYADHMVDDYDLKLLPLHTETSDVIVATSARIKRELEELAGRMLENAIVKPNGIDTSNFKPMQRAPSGAGRVFSGVAVNRIHAKKGVTYLVEAALLLRDRGVPFTIEICGEYDSHDPDGPAYFQQLRQFVAKHALQETVVFLGRQDAAQIRQHLEQKDIFVAPYVELHNGDKDGIPTALLEAMAGGCAIVATDAGSITEVIDDSVEGLLVPQCDAAALACGIERLIADYTLRARLAEGALARVKRQFDVSVCEAIFHERVRAAIAHNEAAR